MRPLHGGNIYQSPVRLDYSVNLNPLGTPSAVLRAAAESAARIGQYPDPEQTALRGALAERLAVPGEWILFGNGAAELIDCYVSALTPTRVLLPEPSFTEYRRALEARGCRIDTLQMSPAAGFQPGPAWIDALHPETDLVMLCSPNNPTGRLFPPALLEQLLVRCRAHRTAVFLDESFIELSDCPAYAADAALLRQNPHLFVLRSFTKSFAMPGLRLGYGMTADPVLAERMQQFLQPWNVSVPAAAAGLAAIADAPDLDRARAVIRTERAFLTECLEACGMTVYASSTCFLLFQGPADLQKRLQRAGILIRDCSDYHGLSEGWFRIAVRSHTDNLEFARVLREVMCSA